MRESHCRHCGQLVGWCLSENGNPMPLDREPAEDGNVIVAYRDGKLVGHVMSAAQTLAGDRPDGVPYMPHFATCPVLNKGGRKPKAPKPVPPEQPRLL